MPVPRGRYNRLARLGITAAGIGADIIGSGLRSAATGQRVALRDLALTPQNALRLTKELSRMRGAAMKVGQLLSMDAGDLLPVEFAEVLARLRADAQPMPPRQLRTVLDTAWGEGWFGRFERFELRPIAAASIGQVHRAQLPDGRILAIKVQFPGVRESINSDIDNVGTLIGLSGVMPPDFPLSTLLDEAKRQLREEADYLAEANHLDMFYRQLENDHRYRIPQLVSGLTTTDVLAMEYVASEPLETLEQETQALRDQLVSNLFQLLFRELFEFGLIQSDPNLANYRFDREAQRIVLLDFGAVRPVPEDVVDGFRRLMTAGLTGDDAGLHAAATALGYIDQSTTAIQVETVIRILRAASEPLRARAGFDFSESDLAIRLRDAGMQLGLETGYRQVPPIDVLYLHRKFGGLYLLARRLRTRVNIADLARPYL